MKHPWEGKTNGDKIYQSVVRAEKQCGGLRSHEEEAEDMASRMLKILDAEIRGWRSAFESGEYNLSRMTPKEQDEMLNDVCEWAKHLLDATTALRLPVNILAYYDELWPKASSADAKLRIYGDLNLIRIWRTYGTNLHTWLTTLADKERLRKVVPKNPLRKVKVKNAELNYVVRKTAQFFYMHYGKTMPTTIERICAIEYPELEVSNNTVSAILRNFNPAETPNL
jgi:hypothetical protein